MARQRAVSDKAQQKNLKQYPREMFDIDDYDTIKTKDQFNDFVNDWASEIVNLNGLRRMFERDRDDKIMFEEALAAHKYMIKYYLHDEILIQLRRGSQNYDGIIYDASGTIIEYIEITGVPREDDHILRAEMAQFGHYPMGSAAHDWPSYDNYAKKASEIIKRKLAKDYPSPCSLLVALSADMVVEEDEPFDYYQPLRSRSD
jgi:hypothetical protein